MLLLSTNMVNLLSQLWAMEQSFSQAQIHQWVLQKQLLAELLQQLPSHGVKDHLTVERQCKTTIFFTTMLWELEYLQSSNLATLQPHTLLQA